MDDRLQLGLIGCGIIAEAHAQACAQIPGLQLVAASNRSAARLHNFTERFGIAQRFQDWRELLRVASLDAVLVCLPEGLHEEACTAAAGLGKHVLVEKPMAAGLAQGERMIAAAQGAGKVLMVAQVVRQYESHLLAKRWIHEGRIGRVRRIERRRLMKGQYPDLLQRPWAGDPALAADWLLYGFGSHEFDAVLWLLETECGRVEARGEKQPERWPGWARISADLELGGAVEGRVELGLDQPAPVWETRVEGSAGSLLITQAGVSLEGRETREKLDTAGAFRRQLEEFQEAIRSGTPPGPSGRSAWTTQALLEGVRNSLATGQPGQAGSPVP